MSLIHLHQMCCRLCLSEANLLAISSIGDITYFDVIYDTTGVRISPTDNLTKNICDQCHNFIDTSRIFRKKCQDSQKILLDMEWTSNETQLDDGTSQSKNHKYKILIDPLKKETLESSQNDLNEEKACSFRIKKEITNNKMKIKTEPGIDIEKTDSHKNTDVKQIINTKIKIELVENTNSEENIQETKLKNLQKDFKLSKSDVKLNKESICSDSDSDNEVLTDLKAKTSYDNLEQHSEISEERAEFSDESDDGIALELKKMQQRVKSHFQHRANALRIQSKRKAAEKRKERLDPPDELYNELKKCIPMGFNEKNKSLCKCNACGKIILRSSLRQHYKIHMGTKQTICCEHCGRQFTNKHLLLTHCKAMHGYERTDKCHYCDFKALNSTLLTIHIRTHTGERPYVCKLCGKNYHRKSTYTQHLETHSENEPVQCDQCPAILPSRFRLSQHKFNRHTLSKFNFQCPVCLKVYANAGHAREHLRKIHGFSAREKKIIRINIT